MLYVLIGIICGIISGMGMGGGSILVLVLTMFLSFNQHVAQGINLIYFIPTSIASIFIYFKNKNVDTIIGKKILFPAIFGAGFGAFLTQLINTIKLKKYFGIFLGVVGILDIVVTINKMKGEKIKK